MKIAGGSSRKWEGTIFPSQPAPYIMNLDGGFKMAKYKHCSFFQVSRLPFQNKSNPAEINELSYPGFKLYIWLHELEHRFTTGTHKKKGVTQDFFFRSNEDLSKDTGMPERTIVEAKNELRSTGFVHIYQMHFIDPATSKKSHKHVTGFKILK